MLIIKNIFKKKKRNEEETTGDFPFLNGSIFNYFLFLDAREIAL
jgi:hypothetical protein